MDAVERYDGLTSFRPRRPRPRDPPVPHAPPARRAGARLHRSLRDHDGVGPRQLHCPCPTDRVETPSTVETRVRSPSRSTSCGCGTRHVAAKSASPAPKKAGPAPGVLTRSPPARTSSSCARRTRSCSSAPSSPCRVSATPSKPGATSRRRLPHHRRRRPQGPRRPHAARARPRCLRRRCCPPVRTVLSTLVIDDADADLAAAVEEQGCAAWSLRRSCTARRSRRAGRVRHWTLQ